MKTLTVILVAVLFTGSSGFLIKVPEIVKPMRTVPMGWMHVQKLLLPLFEDVCEESTNPTIVRISQEFSLDAIAINYDDPTIINKLKTLYSSNKQLPKGKIFTELNQDHMYELQLLFDSLHYAPNFDTFYKTAAWARQNANCGLFVNAIYMAILKRRDTANITVPAPYELLPNYFIRQDVIIKASSLLSGEDVTPTESILNEGNAYTLDANYTANTDTSDESKLAYFREDIGLNSYYFLKRLQYAPWFLDVQDANNHYGEYMYHFMKQLATRYNLERYANGLMPLDNIDWKICNIDPYNPMLVFTNGEGFSQRSSAPEFTSPIYSTLKNIEDNMVSIISPMIQKGFTKAQIINNLMSILVSNLDNYESEARRFFGGDVTIEKRWQSALAHHATMLRDPVFWKINKKIVDIVDDILKTLPSYTRSELYMPGVEIQNVEVKKVMTMFEPFKFDVTDALKSSTENPMFRVNIAQSRLNHKPFTVKLNISSLVTEKGLIKIFLGPKVLPGEFAFKKKLFMLLDSFEVNLKVGSNVISRTSSVIENTSGDFTSLNVLRKLVEDAEFGLEVQPLKSSKALTGFPSRLILPKGTPEGLPMQLLVFMAPFTKITPGGLNLIIPKTEFNSAVLSPGYPFDLDFDDKQFFTLPNVMIRDIVVTHKESGGASKVGSDGSYKWSGGDKSSYGPNKEPFDYNSKKSQYGKTDDYAVERASYNTGYKNDPNIIVPKIENDKRDDKNNLNSDSVAVIRDVSDSYSTKSNSEATGAVLKNLPDVTSVNTDDIERIFENLDYKSILHSGSDTFAQQSKDDYYVYE